MKAKVIETGEIVNVTPNPTWYKMNRHKYIKGDIVRNRYTKKLSLVTEVFDASFVLADIIIPQFGYKTQVTISPLYEFVRHLSNYEFESLINRSM